MNIFPKAWFGRSPEHPTVAEALDLLLPDTVATLASLHHAPASVAQAVVQLLPFGSRAAAEELGIVTPGPTVDRYGRTSLELTAFGYEVIEAAAIAEDADPAGVQALADRWDAALDIPTPVHRTDT